MQHKNATNHPLGSMPTLRIQERLQIKLAGVSTSVWLIASQLAGYS